VAYDVGKDWWIERLYRISSTYPRQIWSQEDFLDKQGDLGKKYKDGRRNDIMDSRVHLRPGIRYHDAQENLHWVEVSNGLNDESIQKEASLLWNQEYRNIGKKIWWLWSTTPKCAHGTLEIRLWLLSVPFTKKKSIPDKDNDTPNSTPRRSPTCFRIGMNSQICRTLLSRKCTTPSYGKKWENRAY
jgi:hypothetical protein